MPNPIKLTRLVTGIGKLDAWIDSVLSAIEGARNIRGSGPIAVNVRPDGTSITFNGKLFTLAKSGASGIAANSSATDVTLYDFKTGTSPASQGVTVKAYNLSASAVAASKMLVLMNVDNKWIVIWEDCG